MNRQHHQTKSRRQWNAIAPEYLLLLRIFGNGETKRHVGAELNRRASQRKPITSPLFSNVQRQPAA